MPEKGKYYLIRYGHGFTITKVYRVEGSRIKMKYGWETKAEWDSYEPQEIELKWYEKLAAIFP